MKKPDGDRPQHGDIDRRDDEIGSEFAGQKFGLTGLIYAAPDVAYIYEGNSVVTDGYTVDATEGQQGVTFASAPNGVRNYIVIFRAR